MEQGIVGIPAADEFDSYYAIYIDRVRTPDIVGALVAQAEETLSLFRGIPESSAGHRYAPGKWSVKEVIGHMIDTERVLAFRALAIAREDTTRLPGFDQDDYAAAANFDARPISEIVDEFDLLRRSSIALFRSFEALTWTRVGIANDVPFSVRSLAYIIAGHETHHVSVIRERYL